MYCFRKKHEYSIYSMDIIYKLITKIEDNNIINLIYSYLGEHPIVQNTNITDSIDNWNFDLCTDDMKDEYTFSFYYFYSYLFDYNTEPSDDYENYIMRLQEFDSYMTCYICN